jgi:hypothetical protein
MLALRSALEAAGQWTATHAIAWDPPIGGNDVTRAWLGLARAAVSTSPAPHHFDADVSFDKYLFPSDAQFADVTFSGMAEFDGATFNGIARFRRAIFSRRTYFRDIHFNAPVDFVQAKFKYPVTFRNSVFWEDADFYDIESAASFSLNDVTFHQVPSFFDATFKDTLRLNRVRTPTYWRLGYAPDRNVTDRFRELRRRAIQAQDRDKELEFFAQEIRTGRFHASGLLPWVPKVWSWRFWVGLLYGTFSDFGRSLWRPVLFWCFAAFYLGEHDEMRKTRAALNPDGTWATLGAYAETTRNAWANPPPCRVQGRDLFAATDALTEAFHLSLRNGTIFEFGRSDSGRRTYGCLFGLETAGEQEYVKVSPRVSLASTVQSLASALLIFFLLLSVRNLLRLR